jgi:hypothetical protein
VGKRLGIGLAKGLVVGFAIGAAITWGAHWSTPSGGLLAYLLAFGVGGTTGIFAGRAPWREGAWVEAAIKGLVGVCGGALFYWLGSTYAAASVPWPGGSAPWTSIPPLFLAAIGGVYGALVELDHDDRDDAAGKTRSTKARVAIDDDEADASPAATRAVRKK